MGKDTIYSRFSQWATRQPDATAVVEDGRSITFDGLDRLADAIMEKFHGERHQFIGIVMSHSIEMIAAMLAVLKSGAAYVPAEPSLPRERLADFMIPEFFVKMEEIPLTARGKVNDRALPVVMKEGAEP